MSSDMERCNINSSGRVQGLETEEVLKCSDGSLPPSALFYIKLVHLNWTGKTEQCSHNSWPDSANLTNTPSPLTWVNVGSLNWVRDYFVAVSVCCNQRSWNDWSHSELLVLQDRQWGLWDRKGWWVIRCRGGADAESPDWHQHSKGLLIPGSQKESSHSTGQRYTSRKPLNLKFKGPEIRK